MFFKIHQATGYYEQFVAGTCPKGKTVAENLLKSIDRNVSEASLNEKARELKGMMARGMSTTVTDVEAFRLSIHELMERQHLHHEQSWHNEIVDTCKAAKN